MRQARQAVVRIGRAVWCETEDDVMQCSLTHLVVGSDVRSGKCLLATAMGAQLVTPEWLDLCCKEDAWLPAALYQAPVRPFPALRLRSALSALSA